MKTLTQAIFKWLFYPTLHLSVSLSCFNKVLEKVGKKMRDRKGKYSSNSGGKFA